MASIADSARTAVAGFPSHSYSSSEPRDLEADCEEIDIDAGLDNISEDGDASEDAAPLKKVCMQLF